MNRNSQAFRVFFWSTRSVELELWHGDGHTGKFGPTKFRNLYFPFNDSILLEMFRLAAPAGVAAFEVLPLFLKYYLYLKYYLNLLYWDFHEDLID